MAGAREHVDRRTQGVVPPLYWLFAFVCLIFARVYGRVFIVLSVSGNVINVRGEW